MLSRAPLGTQRHLTVSLLAALQNQIARTAREEEQGALRAKTVILAIICFCTFDLDQDILARTLTLRETASIMIRCAIVLQEGRDTVAADGAFLHILERRVQRLQHRSYMLLSAYIVGKDAEALHGAVRQSWPAFQATGGWRPLQMHDYWLEIQTGYQGTTSMIQVHFNFLDGDLRVSGEPLGRLPDEYERHPTYRELFGRSRLEVKPSAFPGMRFSGKNTFHDYTLHFGLAGDDLVLRASRGDRCYELVPRRPLNGFYPTLIKDDPVLWYDVTGDCVEFRRNEDAWDASASAWVLTRAGADNSWQLQNDGSFVLPMRSSTAMLACKPLEPLEDPPYMHCLLHTSGILEVHLPRLQLEFSAQLDDSRLSSRQYRGLFVDPTQFAGTFIGLENKLILRKDAVHSFVFLSETSIHLLKQITDLTPARCYYPDHLQCMQVVEWSSNVGFLAQHDSFQADVGALYTKHDDMEMFAMNSHVRTIELRKVNETLRLRDMNRSAGVRISGFGAECFNPDCDIRVAGDEVLGANTSNGAYARVECFSWLEHGRP